MKYKELHALNERLSGMYQRKTNTCLRETIQSEKERDTLSPVYFYLIYHLTMSPRKTF